MKAIPSWLWPIIAFVAGYATCMAAHEGVWFTWGCLAAGVVPLGVQQVEQARQGGGGAVAMAMKAIKRG